MDTSWPKLILKNFGHASINYNKEAEIQRTFAGRLAEQCIDEDIPKGIWVDLGAGTGLLAEALEALNPNQTVLRVDASQEMLSENRAGSQTQLWNLNYGLPQWPQPIALIASSFALHWLDDPTRRIEEWFSALTPGGLLALAVPVKGSFTEWHTAAQATGVKCTALELPCPKGLTKGLESANIRSEQLHCFTQKASNVNSLLKPIVKVGAQASPTARLSVSEWRKLYKAWPHSTNNESVSLTWLIQLLLIQR